MEKCIEIIKEILLKTNIDSISININTFCSFITYVGNINYFEPITERSVLQTGLFAYFYAKEIRVYKTIKQNHISIFKDKVDYQISLDEDIDIIIRKVNKLQKLKVFI